jgi:hypothetical protein
MYFGSKIGPAIRIHFRIEGGVSGLAPRITRTDDQYSTAILLNCSANNVTD